MITLGRTLACSFCGKSQHDVAKLIAGPSVFICDECVNVCVGILHEGGTAPVSSPPTRHRRMLDRVRDWFARATRDAWTLSRLTR
jgi:hypothetical protein